MRRSILLARIFERPQGHASVEVLVYQFHGPLLIPWAYLVHCVPSYSLDRKGVELEIVKVGERSSAASMIIRQWRRQSRSGTRIVERSCSHIDQTTLPEPGRHARAFSARCEVRLSCWCGCCIRLRLLGECDVGWRLTRQS
jgi:hypothetical protein